MNIHVLCIRSTTKPSEFVPMLEPNEMVTERTSRNYPFGFVLFDSTETDRLTAQIAIAELRGIDDPDDLRWLEVTPG